MANKRPSKFRAGMFFSDEPGFYKEGEFGLRLETILRCVKEATHSPNVDNVQMRGGGGDSFFLDIPN